MARISSEYLANLQSEFGGDLSERLALQSETDQHRIPERAYSTHQSLNLVHKQDIKMRSGGVVVICESSNCAGESEVGAKAPRR